MPLPPLMAVVFDLDGTLLDTESAADAAVIAWAAEHGIRDDEIADRWRAISTRHYRRWQTREIDFQGQRRERVREFLGRSLTDAEASALFAGYLERYEAGWRPFDDASGALRRARDAGLAVALLTNGDRDQQLQKLDRFAMREAFDLIVCTSDLPAGKPDPRAYAGVLGPLGVAPDRAVMIGDSYEADYEGAARAGMRAIHLDRDSSATLPATERVGSLDDIVFEV